MEIDDGELAFPTVRPSFARGPRVLAGLPLPLGFGLGGCLLLERRGRVCFLFTVIAVIMARKDKTRFFFYAQKRGQKNVVADRSKKRAQWASKKRVKLRSKKRNA